MSDVTRLPGRILRFDRPERWLHWVNAIAVLFLLVSGTTFRVGALQNVIGHRALVRTIHVWVGIGLVVPWAVALAGPWGAGLRADLVRLGRFTPADWAWLRSRGRSLRARAAVGKFNAGQKVNAVLVGGALPVMLLTGLLMAYHDPFPDAWRTGATFVHDLGWFGLGLLIAGHILKALSEPVALGAMRHGWVPPAQVRRHWPAWADELGVEPTPTAAPRTTSNEAPRPGRR